MNGAENSCQGTLANVAWPQLAAPEGVQSEPPTRAPGAHAPSYKAIYLGVAFAVVVSVAIAVSVTS